MLREVALKTHNALSRAKVDYFLIGKVASSCWGMPAATANIDIVIVAKEKEMDELLQELKKEGFDFNYDKVKSKLLDKLPAKLNYKEGYSIDLRVASYTIDLEALKRAVKLKIFNKEWKIAPPEEIIIYKLASAKPSDWEDIKGILKNEALDLDWVRMEYLTKTLAREYKADFIERFEELKDFYEKLKSHYS